LTIQGFTSLEVASMQLERHSNAPGDDLDFEVKQYVPPKNLLFVANERPGEYVSLKRLPAEDESVAVIQFMNGHPIALGSIHNGEQASDRHCYISPNATTMTLVRQKFTDGKMEAVGYKEVNLSDYR